MLQFSQQAHSTPSTARMLGGLINVNWIKALGMLNLLEHWAANSGKSGQAPEGRLEGPRAPKMLAALLEHRGDPEALVDALGELDIVTRTDTGLRVLGLEERYGPVFEAAATRSKSASNASQVRWDRERKAKEMLAACAADAPQCEPDAEAMPFDAKENSTEEKEIKEEREAPAEQEPLELEPSEPGLETAEHPLQELWNRLAHPDLPRWDGLSKTRKKMADARLKERSLQEYAHIIERISASEFLRGANDRHWTATPDWFLKPANIDKVLEGNYATKPAQPRPGIGAPPLNNCAVCSELAEATIGEGLFACYPHQAAFRASAEAGRWERPWEHAAEWVEAMRAQTEVAA